MTIRLDGKAIGLLLIVLALPLGIFLALRVAPSAPKDQDGGPSTDGAALDGSHSGLGSGDDVAPATNPAGAAGAAASSEAEVPPDAAAASDPEAELARACTEVTAGPHPQLGAGPRAAIEARVAALRADPAADPSALAAAEVEAVRLAMSAADYGAAREHLERVKALALGAGEGANLGSLLYVEALLELRLGEEANCAGEDVHALCLFGPERGGGYTLPEHTERAIGLLERLLEGRPDDLAARWLLNVAHMYLRSYPEGIDPALVLPLRAPDLPRPLPRMEEIAHPLGAARVSTLGGAIMDDFDGDGLLDLFATAYDPCTPVQLLRSDGAGGLVDATLEAGLQRQLGGFNAQQTDVDNDGALDIFITRGGWQGEHGLRRNTLLRNDGSGRFHDATYEAGLARPIYPTQASAWADVDLDGDLDLFIGNEGFHDGRTFPSQLMLNDGQGQFTDAAAAAGVSNDRWAKGVAFGDYDNDGDPDLYVSNLGANRLYENLGDGRFQDRALELGVEEPVGRSFATWFFDYDNDGWLDLYVAGYDADLTQVAADYLGQSRGGQLPRLYRNLGGTGFEDVTAAAGLDHVLLPMGANHGDVDGDGFPDIYLGTGNPEFETQTPNVLYWNDGGERFLDATVATQTGHLPKGHGVAFGDLDNDGDQDLYLQAGGFVPGDRQPDALFRNPGVGHGFLTLQLEGREANRPAIGARIRVEAEGPGGPREIHELVGSGGSFGANSLRAEIGLGDATRVTAVEVRWPGDVTPQRYEGLALGGAYRLVQGEADPKALDLPRLELGAGAAMGHGAGQESEDGSSEGAAQGASDG